MQTECYRFVTVLNFFAFFLYVAKIWIPKMFVFTLLEDFILLSPILSIDAWFLGLFRFF